MYIITLGAGVPGPLFGWPRIFVESVGLDLETMSRPLAADDKFVMVTGCSGTGAPTFAACDIVGRHNVREHLAAEIHTATRSSLAETLITHPYIPEGTIKNNLANIKNSSNNE